MTKNQQSISEANHFAPLMAHLGSQAKIACWEYLPSEDSFICTPTVFEIMGVPVEEHFPLEAFLKAFSERLPGNASVEGEIFQLLPQRTTTP